MGGVCFAVVSFALRRFSLGTPVFPFSQKSTMIPLGLVDEEPLFGCATSKSLFLYFCIINNLLLIFKTYRGDSELRKFNEN